MTALPPIGSETAELVYLETVAVSLTIKGQRRHPHLEGMPSSEQASHLRASCKDAFQISWQNGRQETSSCISPNSIHKTSIATLPLFFEQQSYEIILCKKSNLVIEFYHENIHLRSKVSPVGRSNDMLSGIINFGSEIGLSTLEIFADGKPYLQLQIEIFPTKLDYQADFSALMSDVTEEVYSLAFDFMKKTYLNAHLSTKVGNSETEFYSLIKTIFDQFERATDLVISHPHHVLDRTSEILPVRKIKEANTQTIKWLTRHPQYLLRRDDGIVAYQALACRKQITYDTLENRLVRYILRSTQKRLGKLKEHYARLERRQDKILLKGIDSMINSIHRRIAGSFLSEVGEFRAANSMSLVFSMAPGYKELYRCYLILLHGLCLDGDIFHISVKDLALLYEYWCFIKLNSMMKRKYRLIKQDVLKVEGSGLFVTLKKGVGSEVRYENPKNGEQIHLRYNPQNNHLPTTPQKPDNVLTMTKGNGAMHYRYVFDAKYRLDPALNGSPYQHNYGSPGPEESDINTMHRYRDALVNLDGQQDIYRRSMFGAYVLFPYNKEEEFMNHPFFRSIEQVNIGGLPFLPSATKLVENMLDELIRDSAQSAFERATLPMGIAEKLVDCDLSKRDVLVGTLRNREQLDLNLYHRFYHIPASKIADHALPIYHVALYQSEGQFGKENAGIYYVGEVIMYQKVPRHSIREIPNHSAADELYYRFDVRQWTRLTQPVRVREFGPRVHFFTNLFLLYHSDFVPELFIRSSEEFRLFSELKRLSTEIDFMGDAQGIQGFEFNGCRFLFHREEFSVNSSDGRYSHYSIRKFHAHPRSIFNEICRFIGNV